ncbi:hypothetical protein BDZ97DRAFT_1853528, partial [Flammula alnicola]
MTDPEIGISRISLIGQSSTRQLTTYFLLRASLCLTLLPRSAIDCPHFTSTARLNTECPCTRPKHTFLFCTTPRLLPLPPPSSTLFPSPHSFQIHQAQLLCASRYYYERPLAPKLNLYRLSWRTLHKYICGVYHAYAYHITICAMYTHKYSFLLTHPSTACQCLQNRVWRSSLIMFNMFNICHMSTTAFSLVISLQKLHTRAPQNLKTFAALRVLGNLGNIDALPAAYSTFIPGSTTTTTNIDIHNLTGGHHQAPLVPCPSRIYI